MNEDRFLAAIAGKLRGVGGIRAVVLDGSRVSGTRSPESDYDLGLYYDPDAAPDLVELDRVAADLDDSHRPGIITPLGGWGPWINGGGWLTISGRHVDFLYRDLTRVRSIIDACRAGHVEVSYQPGHPHGFVTAIYMGEIDVSRPLWEKDGCISALKELTRPHPANLKRALIDKFTWEIDFALRGARKAAERGDVVYAAGCCFRAVSCMVQVLLALSEHYCLNEKGGVALVGTLPQRPAGFPPACGERLRLARSRPRGPGPGGVGPR